ncbi:MAG: hypothetical protein QW420_06255 [Candidatus Caldarchaeum sp.]
MLPNYTYRSLNASIGMTHKRSSYGYLPTSFLNPQDAARQRRQLPEMQQNPETDVALSGPGGT